MLARVAENMYWLTRYLERAENTVRLLNGHSNLLMDLPGLDEHQAWMPMISINGLDEEFQALHDSASEESVNYFLLADKENPGSLFKSFVAIQENLRCCRDILPKASYEAINSLCRFIIKQAESSYAKPSQRQAFLGSAEERLLAISGSLNSSMSHDIAYHIMRLGCYLERADMTSRIIDVQSTRLSSTHSESEAIAIDGRRWVSVLRTLAAHQMYRQQIRRPVNGYDTLSFLLQNDKLPRSYTFCLDHLEACVRKLSKDEAPLAPIRELKQQVSSADFATLAQNPLRLHTFLDDLQLGMLSVSSAISLAYFPPVAPLPEPVPEPTAAPADLMEEI